MANRPGGFGYIRPPVDGRDFKFLAIMAKEQINEVAGKPNPRKRAYKEGPLLNQGQTPRCVGFSAKGFLNAAPIMSKDSQEPSADAIYRLAQKHDPWPGENYDGSSVGGGCEAMKEQGVIVSYVHFTTIQQVADWTNNGYGTVLIGTDWFAQMDDVNSKGFIQMPGNLATPIGGHAYRLNWFDKAIGGFLTINTWGPNWGLQRRNGTFTGTAYMRLEDADRLCFKLEGEVCAPTQIKIKPTVIK